MKNLILSVCAFFICSYNPLSSQELAGNWYGIIDVEGADLKVAFHLQDTSGYWEGTMDVPNAGAFKVPLDTAYSEIDSIFLVSEKLNSSFRGKVNLSRQIINGSYQLYGTNYSLRLTRDSFEVAFTGRPQDPTKVDYYIENVMFANYVDSVVLSGTITMPFDPEIKKAVILVSAAGPQDRNHELRAANHRPFLVLADYLTRQGIAVLRYDDRGVGLSTGNFFTATTADFAQDARAALDYLRQRVDLENTEIGILGIDEGGIISGMIGDSADFNIMLGTPGTNITDILLAQTYLSGTYQGIPDSIIGINFRMYAQVYNYIKQSQHLETDSLQKNLKVLLKRGYDKYPSEIRDSIRNMDQIITNQAIGLSSPWYRYYTSIEPGSYLKQITNPVLATIGTLDMEIPYQTNLAGIEMALQEAGNTQYEVFGFDGVNHYFQAAISGAPSEYGLITETMNEDVMSAISEWINTH